MTEIREELEKMTALKKAYAEIILNTVKEAATRIMVSERKAHQFEHDLSSTKDEALRLLLRVKQTMDSKIKEAEVKSLNQQKRIEELEAQLQEAEDIVSNLRVELNEAHLKLDEMTKTQTPNAREMVGKAVHEEGASREVTLVPYAPEEKPLRDVADSHCVANSSFDGNAYPDVPDVPSIIVRSKKTELYRNGCTQRIRACEGNLLNGHFSMSQELDDLKGEKIVGEGNEGDILDKTLDVVSEIKEVKNAGKTSSKGPSLTRRKRKRGARYRKSNSSTLKSFSPVAEDALPDCGSSQTCLPSSYNAPESFGSDVQCKQSLSPSPVPCNVLEIHARAEHTTVAKGEERSCKAHNSAEEEDREVASSLVLIRQQNGSGNCLHAPSSDPKGDLKNVSPANLDAKGLEKADGFPSPQAKDRVLKYTFQRKRKKESLIISDNTSSLQQDNSLKRKMGKKLNDSLELAKSTVESSRDSRRMAQVARQLISLSEKKWWK